MTSPPIPVRSTMDAPRSAFHAERPTLSASLRMLTLTIAVSAITLQPASAQTNAPGADLRLVTCAEERPGAVPGPLRLRAVVKNAGTGQSVDATLHVKLVDAAGAFVAVAFARLDNGAVDPGAEQAFLVTIPDCPAYRRLVPTLLWTTGFVSMGGGDFTTSPRLEVGQCLFRRGSNGDLLVTGKVRNGRAETAGEVSLTFAFRGESGQEAKTASRRLKGVIPPGATARFLWRIPECPPVASAGTAVSGVDVPPAADPFDEGLNAREEGLAASAVRDPDAVAAAPAVGAAPGGAAAAVKKDDAKPVPPPEPPPPPYTLAVDGVEWVGGTFRAAGGTKTLRYTGDTAFLKIRVTDAKGNVAQPEATVVVKVVDKTQPRGFCKRPVTKAAWKLDAEKITKENASPEIVAFHAKDGALWIGLVTVEDSSQVDLTLDVSVEIRKAGTWAAKGLRAPFAAELALEPEKKK
jgi:hypothetical protein